MDEPHSGRALYLLEKPTAPPAGRPASSSMASPPDDKLAAMKDCMDAEPYRPEDNMQTAEEMWSGFSSDDGEQGEGDAPEVAAAPGPSGRGTPAGAAGPADAGSEGGGSSSSSRGVDWDEVEEREMRALDAKLDALCPCPGPAPSSARQATFQPPPRSAGAEAVAPKGPPKGPSAEQIQRLLESDAAVDFGALLTDVCKAEPYQPEDHEFTAEDMWGDSDDDAVAVRGNAALDAVVDRDNHHLTADEMWGGYSDGSDAGDANEAADGDIAALARAATVDVAVKAAESATQAKAAPRQQQPAAAVRPAPSAASSAGPDDAERLRRILAGADAPRVLGDLGLAELARVAQDCQKAVETIGWVMQRQQEIIRSASMA